MLDVAASERRSLAVTKYPIFYVETAPINLLVSQIHRVSSQITKLRHQKGLPPVAVNSYLKTLLKNEIYFTNDIEGVRTNPAEIGTIIGNLQDQPGKKKRRLESTIRKYNDSLTGRMRQINRLEDFRAIFDELLKGEIPSDKLPDGKLFRNTFAFIGSESHAVHIPPVNEEKVDTALEQLITFMNNDDYVPLEKALVTHFMFENTHPFSDGNGRTGRYLLSSYLSSKVDPFTGLSISTAIHNNLSRYYKLFQEADNVENRGELTFFIEGMLRIILSGQQEVMAELTARREQLKVTSAKLAESMKTASEEQREIMYVLLQSYLFTESQTYGIQDRDIEEFMKRHSVPKAMTKRSLASLEQTGMITKVSRRPLQHVISPQVLKMILTE